MRQVTPDVDQSINLKPEVHYGNRIIVKEISSSDIINVLESDSSERDSASHEDLKFLVKLRKNIVQNDSDHNELPLLFKEDRPNLPNYRRVQYTRKLVADHIQKIKASRPTKPEQWAYVESEDDPADHVSCSLTAQQLKNSKMNRLPESARWERLKKVILNSASHLYATLGQKKRSRR